MSMAEQQPMSMAQVLAAQFEAEMALTRKALERVPFDKADWAPHEKSMTMSRLAGHIAEMPGWGASMLDSEEFNMNPPGGEPYEPTTVTSSEQLLTMFDAGVEAANAKLPDLSDEAMMATWTLKSGEDEIVSGPRGAIFGNMIINHVIHHRGQLTVYLRLCDVAVPAIYGPSADEQ